MRRPVTQRLMRPFVVVKLEIVGKMRPRRRDRLVVVKINLLVLDRPPEPLHKNVVVDPAAAIHAHSDPRILQKLSCEIHAREMRTLVRVENLRTRDPERFPQRLQTKARVQCRRKLPGHHIPAVPVHDRRKINESMGETDIRLSRRCSTGRERPCRIGSTSRIPSPRSGRSRSGSGRRSSRRA